MSNAAEASKEKGNQAFQKAQYDLALAHYSTSIQLDPSTYLYPLNRSLVHLKLSDFKSAEKDATTALSLDPVEASKKAYYRRALARKGLQKYALAEEDFKSAKEAGADSKDIDQELQKLSILLNDSAQQELPLPPHPPPNKSSSDTSAQIKVSKSPTTSVSSPKLKSSSTVAATPGPPSKDRLRAALVSDSSSRKVETSTASSEPEPNAPPAPAKQSQDLMAPISTRSLSRTSPKIPDEKPSTTKSPILPNSFAAKEQERNHRFASSLPSAPTSLPSVNPSVVAKSELPAPPETLPNVEAASAPPPSPPKTALPSSPQPRLDLLSSFDAASWTPELPPKISSPDLTSSTFEHNISSTSLSPSLRLHYLRSIPPSSLPTLLKEGALTPDLLSSILDTLTYSKSKSEGIKEGTESDEWLLSFLHHLSTVDRFDMNLMFLSDEEKALAKDTFDRAEQGLKKSRERWGL